MTDYYDIPNAMAKEGSKLYANGSYLKSFEKYKHLLDIYVSLYREDEDEKRKTKYMPIIEKHFSKAEEIKTTLQFKLPPSVETDQELLKSIKISQ